MTPTPSAYARCANSAAGGARACRSWIWKLLSFRALHTLPPRVVAAGTDSVLAFQRDLGGGSAPCHLVKLVLLGEQRVGKSSQADSLVRVRLATRPADDLCIKW